MIIGETVLILKSGRGDFEKYYIDHMQDEHVVTEQIYKNYSGIKWGITWLWAEIFRLPLLFIWYGKWRYNLFKYDTIIVFDNNLNWSIISYLKKHNPDARIIVWYWNVINRKNRLPYKYRKWCEEWSFNPQDCKQYAMRYNHQFYFYAKCGGENIASDTHTDFFFIGKDKSRIYKIEEVERRIAEAGYKTDFRVVRDRTSKKKKSPLYIKKQIAYNEVLNLIQHCRCIVEFNQELQDGMTARSLEAFFYNKKLLTDNRCIVNYYNSPNIMTLSSDLKKEELDKFVKAPLALYTDICESYSFQHWVQGFG